MSFRSLFAVALAATLAVPAFASAQAKRGTKSSAAPARQASASGTKQIWIGGLVGLELGDLDGFGFRVDGEMPLKPLSPKVNLSLVGSVGYSRLSMDLYLGDVGWNIFKVVPAARFTMPVAPKMSLYGDAGLGLYYGSFTMKQNFPAPIGTIKTDDSATGFLMRFGVGGFYDLNPKTKLSAEIGVDPYFGDADTTNWTLAVGAMFVL